MAEHEDIVIDDDGNDAAGQGQPLAAADGAGSFMNSMMGMFGFANQDQENHKEEEEKKEEDAE